MDFETHQVNLLVLDALVDMVPALVNLQMLQCYGLLLTDEYKAAMAVDIEASKPNLFEQGLCSTEGVDQLVLGCIIAALHDAGRKEQAEELEAQCQEADLQSLMAHGGQAS